MQQSKESVIQFHSRLLALWARAYPNWANNEEMPIRRFAQGLRRQKVKEQVLRANPQTYEAALQAAQAEVAIVDAHLAGFGQGGIIPGGAAAVEPMEIGALADIQCHTCKKMGHMARNCTKGKKDFKARPWKKSKENGGATSKDNRTKPGNQSGGAWKDKDRRQRFKQRIIAQLDDLDDSSCSEDNQEEDDPDDDANSEDDDATESERQDF
jgi:hypothetical protein